VGQAGLSKASVFLDEGFNAKGDVRLVGRDADISNILGREVQN
jgi:hypothetical protein